MIRTNKNQPVRVSQGHIYKDVEHMESYAENDGEINISKIVFPYVFVLTQDCDLLSDFRIRDADNQDKKLISVLVAPIYNAEHVYLGTHLDDIGMKMLSINKGRTPGDNLRKNETPRYHYLDFNRQEIDIVPSVIDFKHYFTVNISYLEHGEFSRYVCSVSELFRERVCQRFSNYLSRIGLP